MDNLVKDLAKYIKLKEFLTLNELEDHQLLTAIVNNDLQLYAHVDEGALIEIDEYRNKKRIGTVIDEFLEVYPEAFYGAFVNGVDLTSNFLKTERPIEDWLPDFDWSGLYYDTTPSVIKIENLYLKRVRSAQYSPSGTTGRHNDIVVIQKNWSQIRIGDDCVRLSRSQHFLLEALYCAQTSLEIDQLVRIGEEQKYSLIIRSRDKALRRLVVQGDGKLFPKRHFKASQLLKNAVFAVTVE